MILIIFIPCAAVTFTLQRYKKRVPTVKSSAKKMWASVKNEDYKESSEFEFVKMALNVTCDIVTFWV